MTACDLCRGACCESWLVPVDGEGPAKEWLLARGRQIKPRTVEVETVCPQLRDGRCSIYATRPKVCELYRVGGPVCRETVRRRRPGQAAEILALLP